jgi:hypothetical protein
MTRWAFTLENTGRPGRHNPIWIPLGLIWFLLLPFVILVSPLVFIACIVLLINPFRGVWIYFHFYNGLRGLRIRVDDPRSHQSVRIS